VCERSSAGCAEGVHVPRFHSSDFRWSHSRQSAEFGLESRRWSKVHQAGGVHWLKQSGHRKRLNRWQLLDCGFRNDSYQVIFLGFPDQDGEEAVADGPERRVTDTRPPARLGGAWGGTGLVETTEAQRTLFQTAVECLEPCSIQIPCPNRSLCLMR
jgi:hypothetical protein